MRTIDIGVSHDDDAVVTQFGDVEVIDAWRAADPATLSNAGAQRSDQRQDFIAGQQFFVTRFFNIQDFAAERQNRLKFAIAALFGRATGRIALYQVNFTTGRIFFLTVSKLAGQTHAIQYAFATRHVARFARCFTCPGRFNDLANNDFGVVWALLQVIVQQAADNVFHRTTHFAGHQFVFGLAGEFWFRHLHTQHAAQAFPHVVARHLNLCFFGQLAVVDVFVDDPSHRSSQTRQVSTTITLGNIVGKAKNLLAVAAVPLHRQFHTNVGALIALSVTHGSEHVGMQYGFAFVDEAHEPLDTVGPGKVILLARTFIFQPYLHAVVQKAEFAQAFA